MLLCNCILGDDIYTTPHWHRGQGVQIRAFLPAFFLGPVQTWTLSALSDSQTAEGRDPLPDLPISSQRNSTNEALWGTDAQRAARAKTTCHSHLMITHTVMPFGRGALGWIVFGVFGAHMQWYLFCFLQVLKPCVRVGLLYTLMIHLHPPPPSYVTSILLSPCLDFIWEFFEVTERSAFIAAGISAHVRQEKCPLCVVCNFNKDHAPQKTLYILSKEMKWFIITVQKSYQSRIMPATRLESHMATDQHQRIRTLLALAKWVHSNPLRLQASTSITAVNVRTCLCLCKCPVYTPVPCVVCIGCG